MILAKKKLKLGLWVSFFFLALLPVLTVAQQSTTIKVEKKQPVTNLAVSLFGINDSTAFLLAEHQQTFKRKDIPERLELKCKHPDVVIVQFTMHFYVNDSHRSIKHKGNNLSPDAIDVLKRFRTYDAIIITVENALDAQGNKVAIRPLHFYVN